MTTAVIKREAQTETNPEHSPVNRIDIKKAFELRFIKQLSYGQIADHFGVRKQSVYKALKKYQRIMKNPEIAETYTENRRIVLNAIEWQMVNDMADPSKRKNASLNNVAYAFTQIHNARRLEEDLSTANVNHQSLIIEASRLKQEREALEAELKNL